MLSISRLTCTRIVVRRPNVPGGHFICYSTAVRPGLKEFYYPFSKTIVLALMIYFGLHAWKTNLILQERRIELRDEIDRRRADLDSTIALQESAHKDKSAPSEEELDKKSSTWFPWSR